MEPTSAAKRIATKQVLIIAHRGNSSEAPENTLPAFASAVKLGADMVELDYFHSADGVPVVFHDANLDRTTNAPIVFGKWKVTVQAMTLAELRKLDAGQWFDQRFAKTKIPTLEESLDEIQKGSVTLIEQKSGDAATCVKLLKRKHLVDEVVVQSFNIDFVRDCHKLCPQLTVAVLGNKRLPSRRLDELEKTGASVIVWDHRDLAKKEIEEIHKRGLKAWVYTVDDPQRARQLINAGIDGIITNRPELLIKLRDKMKNTP